MSTNDLQELWKCSRRAVSQQDVCGKRSWPVGYRAFRFREARAHSFKAPVARRPAQTQLPSIFGFSVR